jgi:sugar lactone lactonase YvrE
VSPSHWNQAPFYFADGFYGRVRKVDSQGIISTIAGNGGVGYSGDGGPALQATLFYPQAVTVDKGGYVYVSDWGNGVVRRIAPDGIITTLVGGLMYPAGLAVDAKGTLYVADPGNNRIVAVANPQQ